MQTRRTALTIAAAVTVLGFTAQAQPKPPSTQIALSRSLVLW